MEVITLESGSAGNCVFVRSGETRLLFDAGISGSDAESRLAEYGYDIRDCNALVLSHEHSDHISGLQKAIGTLDAVLIESNYDADMLRFGPYPQHLKDRISGKRGHLSNQDAAELLDACDANQLQWACLGHLSAQNNSPEVALATHRERHGDRFPLFCADRDGALRLPTIEEPKFSLTAGVSAV